MNILEASIVVKYPYRKYKNAGEFKLVIREYTLDSYYGTNKSDKITWNPIFVDPTHKDNYINVLTSEKFVNNDYNKIDITLNGESIKSIESIPDIFKMNLFSRSRHRPTRTSNHKELLFLIYYALNRNEMNPKQMNAYYNARILSRQFIDGNSSSNCFDLWIVEVGLLVWQLVKINISIKTERVNHHVTNIFMSDLDNLDNVLDLRNYTNCYYKLSKREIVGSTKIEFTNNHDTPIYIDAKNQILHKWIKKVCLARVYEVLPPLISKYINYNDLTSIHTEHMTESLYNDNINESNSYSNTTDIGCYISKYICKIILDYMYDTS